ncbi:MAG: GHMP kinase [Lentisphaerae bacterium]|nr:GHMP kinase [Lentisphaerota bacterium]
MKIFVPGRICLFGEHTDWAGSYRRINGEIERGLTIITGTNHGLYADVKPHPSKLIIRSTVKDGQGRSSIEIRMDRESLLEEAGRGGVFSYAAGVAYQVMTHYRVRGLEVDNYLTDLPIKKGLSSSAAVCVLIARAFNRLYDLKMTVRGEMEFAYLGEITTPSRCGRMDQGCAYGNRPTMMTFDGERMDVDELTVKRDLYYVIVDLCAGKDTREILNQLNHCYPFAKTEAQRAVQGYLGPTSERITRAAAEAIENGDIEKLGSLMKEAQAGFDRCVAPVCPQELTAPVLHKVLSYPPVQDLVLGGKGVGSQGDGSAQFLVRNADDQKRVMEIIQTELKMPCLDLVVRSAARVRKALIPAAGFGTRLFPATKAIKKELFPVLCSDGRMKPVMLVIVEEALAAGIEEVCIVVQPQDKELFEDFFRRPPAVENFNKLPAESKKYADYLLEVGRRITFVTQSEQEGFGHAVMCAREWVNGEPFLLMLGDHLYESDIESNCARQLIDAYGKAGKSVVGLQETPGREVRNFGCVSGIWTEEGSLLSLTDFVEKPDAAYARENLAVEGMKKDTFLTVFGMYVLKPEVFAHIEERIRGGARERGEFQLTSCLDQVRQEDGFFGLVVKGRRFDVGLPESYRQTMVSFSRPRRAAKRRAGQASSPGSSSEA